MNNNEEYLALFKKIQSSEKEEEMLRETPNYEQYENLNEVQRRPQQPQNFNMNEFNIETRVNGESLNETIPNQQYQQQNINEIKKQRKQEKLNEVFRIREQERLNAVKEQQRLNELKKQQEQEKLLEIKKKQEEEQRLNENINFKDIDIVTLDMFNKARYNSMMQIANKTLI